MAIDLNSLSRSRAVAAPRILLYGTAGIGKSTFAASGNNPLYQPAEDVGPIESTFLPKADTIGAVMDGITAAYQQEHSYETYVLDSLSALERLIFAQVAKDQNKSSVEEIPYGKGFGLALDYWQELLSGLDAIRNERNMCILLVAHCEVEKFNDPMVDSYDQYRPALHKTASQMVRQWADAVLFVNYRTFVHKEEAGFGKKLARGIGTGERIIHTTERPAYLAKNRYSLPDEMPLSWPELFGAINAYFKSNTDGKPKSTQTQPKGK